MLALLGLSVGVAAVAVAGIGIGPVPIGPLTVLDVLRAAALGESSSMAGPTESAIILEVRLPRVLLGLAVGAGLAVCGAALQAMVRNMLADPYLLGINSGASTGAAASLLFGIGAGLGPYALTGSAFLGALAASLLTFAAARSGGRLTSVRLLLAGVAVGYALYAATSFLVFASDNVQGARSVMFWLLGSLALASWGGELAVALVVVALTVVALTLTASRLDALAVGDDTAQVVGISPTALRTQLLALVSLCIGVAVAAAGSIGFVGLVVPHLARRIVGAAHRWVIPCSAALGAALLVLADLLARTVFSPQEVPIGIITALVGAPFLLLLIRRLNPSS